MDKIKLGISRKPHIAVYSREIELKSGLQQKGFSENDLTPENEIFAVDIIVGDIQTYS